MTDVSSSSSEAQPPAAGPKGAARIIEFRGVGVWFRMQNQSRGGSLLDLLLPGRGEQRRHWALRDVDFTVCEGESWGIIGHNGAGKSTLCLMLARILTPDEGTATVRGEVTPLVTLGAAFNPALSGRENLALYAAYLGIAPDMMRERTPEIIEFAELAEFIDEPIRTYSTGMRARLGFAVATSLKPEILILDEVLSVGDRDFRAKSKAKIESLMADSKCILTVSHSVSFLRQIATHCLWLDRGRVKMAGPAREVLDAYEADGGAAGRRK